MIELKKAVVIDPLYANEYIQLINIALEKKQEELVIAMINDAIRILPENPLVRLRKAQLLIDLRRGPEAIGLLHDLKSLPWSEIYYPQIRNDIDQLLEIAHKGS